MQLFVRGLESHSRIYDIESSCSVADLKLRIEAEEGLPSCSQVLVYQGRQLQDERGLTSYGVTPDSTLHLVLRLRGGKGGFGALLRGLGRDGSKTTNDDAMRDLQGRRMRHSNAEKKMKEWEAKAKERELEKIALKHIKEQERLAKKEQEEKVEVASVIAAQKAAVAGVQDAVRSVLVEFKAAAGAGSTSGAAAGAGASAGSSGPGKRSAAAGPAAAAAGAGPSSRASGPAPKRSRMLAALETFGGDEDDSEESSSDEEGDDK